MDKKIKFAVLGVGHIGKRHAEMILANPEAELVALIDTKPKTELDIDEFNTPFFSSLEDFLSSDISCQVVNIATPNGLHATHALACLDKQKHVVIEKPISLTKADANSITQKSDEVNRHVFTVMQNRYSPPARWLKNIIEEGLMGEIYMVQLNCYWNRDERYYTNDTWHGSKQLDGGTLFTQFSHFIDLLYWLFGELSNIQSRLFNFNHQMLTEFEDSGVVNFELDNGAAGSINFSTAVWDKNLESSLTIIAKNGTVKIGGQYMDKVEYCHIKDYTLPQLAETNFANQYGFTQGSAANHQYVIQNVIDVIKVRALLSPQPREAIGVIGIIEKIYNSVTS